MSKQYFIDELGDYDKDMEKNDIKTMQKNLAIVEQNKKNRAEGLADETKDFLNDLSQRDNPLYNKKIKGEEAIKYMNYKASKDYKSEDEKYGYASKRFKRFNKVKDRIYDY